MIISKFSSSKEIVENVYRDNGYQTELPWVDLQYWIYEALELLQSSQQYIPKVAGVNNFPALEIENYKAVLPCDFHKLSWILVNGCPATLQEGATLQLLDGDCCDNFTTSIANEAIFKDGFGNIFSSGLGSISAIGSCKDITFTLNNNYLTLSVKEGTVCMGYLAFSLDSEGFPLIPDDNKYKIAITKYLTKKLDYIEWRKGNLPKEVYDNSEEQCNWAMGSASNNVKTPDVHQMEAIKNSLLRLMPRNTQYKSLFRYLGSS